MKVLSSHDTGSRVICDPPVMNTDHDILILVDNLCLAMAHYEAHGWTNCLHTGNPYVEEGNGEMWCAFRKGIENHIITADVPLYLRSVGATLIAKELNLQSKDDRIALFRCLKFGEAYKGELP